MYICFGLSRWQNFHGLSTDKTKHQQITQLRSQHEFSMNYAFFADTKLRYSLRSQLVTLISMNYVFFADTQLRYSLRSQLVTLTLLMRSRVYSLTSLFVAGIGEVKA